MIVCAAFAALWTSWATPMLSALPELLGWATICIVAALSGTLLIAGVATIRRGRQLSLATGVGDSAPRDMRRGFMWVLLGEIAALNVAAYLLIGHHMVQCLGPAFALIVGLHFLPLAKIFRAPYYFATAIVMMLAGVVAVAAMATGCAATTATGMVDLTCAAALWATGFISWSRVHTASAVNRFIITATDPVD